LAQEGPAPAEPSPKQAAAAEAKKPVVERKPDSELTANEAANKAEAKAEEIGRKNAGDMGSIAATWAGSGAPPQITAGDTAVMAAPRPGFDPSLNPGGSDSIESDHTAAVAAANAKPAAKLEKKGKAAKALA